MLDRTEQRLELLPTVSRLYEEALGLLGQPMSRLYAEEDPPAPLPKEAVKGKELSPVGQKKDFNPQSLSSTDKDSLALLLFEYSRVHGDKELARIDREIKRLVPGADAAEIKFDSLPPAQLHEIAREKVLKLAREHISGKPLEGFQKNMERLEKRVKDGLIDDLEAAKTYVEIVRLLQAADGPVLTRDNLLLCARQCMFMAGSPGSVEQGSHKTCNVAALQVRTLALYPSDVVRVVADVGITGKFKTSDGKEVDPDPQSLKPDAEAELYPTPDGKRYLASQIFQVTAVNMYWSDRTKMNFGYEPPANLPEGVKKELAGEFKPGQLRYIQEQKTLDKTEEQLQFLSSTGWVKIADSPHLDHDRISSISRKMTGKTELVLMAHDDAGYANDSGVLDVHNLKSFTYQLDSLRQGREFILNNRLVRGKFPIVVVVNVANEPFKSDAGLRPSADNGDWHVVTIMGYEPASKGEDRGKGLLIVDNTWRRSLDHTGEPGAKPKITVEELFEAMQKPR